MAKIEVIKEILLIIAIRPIMKKLKKRKVNLNNQKYMFIKKMTENYQRKQVFQKIVNLKQSLLENQIKDCPGQIKWIK